MKIVQPLLIIALVAIFILYLAYFRTHLLDRLIALTIFVAGFLAILFPDSTGQIAQFVGVGRGVDLCLYIFSLATMFSLVLLYSKIARLERLNTQLVRCLAIQNAAQPGVAADSTPSTSASLEQ
jgi:hypothetical protein